jgi:hypothetical protein
MEQIKQSSRESGLISPVGMLALAVGSPLVLSAIAAAVLLACTSSAQAATGTGVDTGVASEPSGIAISGENAAKALALSDIAIGNAATTGGGAIGGGAVGAGEGSIAIGSELLGAQTGVPRAAASADGGGVAIGGAAKAGGGVAIGQFSAVNNRGVAVGERALASGYLSVAIGSADPSALGNTTTATAQLATAVGPGADATAFNSTALGMNARASGGESIAAGSQSVASGGQSVATGYLSAASGASSIAIGDRSVATGLFSTSLGGTAKASQTGSTALGVSANASASAASALGQQSAASADRATALGTRATASAADSVAIGSNSVANVANTVSFGSAGAERRLVNVADPTGGTDAVNLRTMNAALAALPPPVANDANAVHYDAGAAQVTLAHPDPAHAGEVKLTNVADGAAATDAVNVRTLDARLAALPPANDANAVHYNAGEAAVTLGSPDPALAGQEIKIENVADGAAATDAVNVRQLQAAIAAVPTGISAAELGATESRLNSRIDDVEKKAYGGVALAMSMSQVVFFEEDKRNALSMGAGYYGGESALGVSYNRRVDTRGRTDPPIVSTIVGAGVGVTSGGTVGARVGVSWSY